MADQIQRCAAGAEYLVTPVSNPAKECAEELSKKTGRQHATECRNENLSDGMPGRVYAMYCKVIQGTK